MAPEGIVEPIDVAANRPVRLLAGVADSPPDEPGFKDLEERLPHRAVAAMPLAGYRDQDAMLLELGLMIDRAIPGGDKGWSRHLDKGGCGEYWQAAFGLDRARRLAVARSALGGAA